MLGSDKYGVRDAAEQVFVEYDPLPVVVDPEKALEAASPLVHEDFGTNQTHEWTIGGGDMDAAWAEADVIVERRIVNHRTAGAPIEPRAGVADHRGGSLTLHLTSQNPHLIRLFMAGELGMSEDRIRVIAPDVGGGFGVKITHYGEEVLAAWASRKLGRPVKWTETRSEHMSRHDPRPRPDRLREGRRQARRHDRRARVHGDLRPRRLLHAAHAVHPVLHRAS